jgi:hypothetical protein
MKKILLFFPLILICLSSYSQKDSELSGAWEMTYQGYVTADTSYERTQFEHPSVKVLSKKCFSFCAESGRGHTGTYFYDGKIYKEVIKYSYNQSLVDQTTEFKSKIEDNKWQIEGTIMIDGHEVELEETWQRID